MSDVNSATSSRVVVGNEKGGTGKSTSLIHVTSRLFMAGIRLLVLILIRAKKPENFFENRQAVVNRKGLDLPIPYVHKSDLRQIYYGFAGNFYQNLGLSDQSSLK